MEKNKKSESKLNRHQSECNGLSKRIKRTTRIINEIRPNTKEMDNIAETYRNKILEIDRELEDQSIDFWSKDFELREAIVFSLQEKLAVGLSNILHVATQVMKLSTTEEITKTAKRRRNKYINEAILNLYNANSSIKNYNIKDNINETILIYFLKSENLNSDNIAKKYLRIKEIIKKLGIENYCVEPEVLQIISYRKENKDSREILRVLYQNEKEVVRTRTLQ